MQSNEQENRRQLELEAILGELAGTMVHEFNNFLNTLLLQITMMETTAPATLATDFSLIRQEGKKIAKVIKDWQRLKKTRPDLAQPIDINQILRDLILDPEKGFFPSAKISLELTEGPLWIQGSFIDLRRLCFLLVQACPEGTIVVRTKKLNQQILLTIIDNGPALTAQALTEVFDPVRSERSGLELGACKALARRLGGRLLAENDSQGGIAISLVTLSADS